LRKADAELLSEWAQGEAEPDRAVVGALHRAAGLKAKAKFLGELREGAEGMRRDMESRRTKYERKIRKFQRPKNYGVSHGRSAMDEKFLAKLPKYTGRAAKARKRAEALSAFDDYGSFDLSNDPELWWVVMTGKQPGSTTPSLRRWYDRNPRARPILRTDPTLDAAAAAAVADAARAASRALDLGYVS
jgi:hypothetical protein